MREERMKILEMLSEGKITVNEAEELLTALEEPGEDVKSGKKRKYLKINVFDTTDPDGKAKVNIRVPFKLVKWGLRFAPKGGRINIGDEQFTQAEFDEMIEELTEGDIVEIISEEDDKFVKIFVE